MILKTEAQDSMETMPYGGENQAEKTLLPPFFIPPITFYRKFSDRTLYYSSRSFGEQHDNENL